MLFVIDDRSMSAQPGEMEAIDAFNASLQNNGHWILAAGIGAPETAKVFDGRSGQDDFSKGSIFEGKDFFSGFWIIEAENQIIAESLATEGSKACNRRVELRPFL